MTSCNLSRPDCSSQCHEHLHFLVVKYNSLHYSWLSWYIFLQSIISWRVSHNTQSRRYSRGKKYRHPYYISPIEMRSFWTEMKYVKSAARLLDRNCVNKKGLDLSKEVLWVSVGQRAAELQAFKVGGKKKILPICPARVIRVRTGPIGRIFFWPSTLTSHKTHFDLWRPKVPL